MGNKTTLTLADIAVHFENGETLTGQQLATLVTTSRSEGNLFGVLDHEFLSREIEGAALCLEALLAYKDFDNDQYGLAGDLLVRNLERLADRVGVAGANPDQFSKAYRVIVNGATGRRVPREPGGVRRALGIIGGKA